MSTVTTLEEFYYGNIIPHEIPIIKGSEYDTANRLVVRHDEALTATLTELQKEIFQKYKDSSLELLTLGERDAFIRGFSLGIKIAVEALYYLLIKPINICRVKFRITALLSLQGVSLAASSALFCEIFRRHLF